MSTEPIINAPSINLQNLDILRKYFPQALELDAQGRYVVNATKLQLALDPAGVRVDEDGYELRWVGKREAYHTAFSPVDKILKPLPQDSKHWDTTGNVLLRGDNIDALRLLRQNYFEKIKLIYIDPPYNTQSDAFIYQDNFGIKQSQVLAELGYAADDIDYIKNIYGAKTHSGWLSFMYPRLLLAKDLLREDGVIFISIDDNEQAQLKLLCDEVFGESSFIALFPWRKRTAKSDVAYGVSQDFEYVMAYAKPNFLAGIAHERKYYTTPDYPSNPWRLADLTTQRSELERPNSAFDLVNPRDGKVYPHNAQRTWSVSKDTFDMYYQQGKIVFPGDYEFLNITIPAFRVFESEDKAKALKKYGVDASLKVASTQFPKEIGLSEDGNKDIVGLFGEKLFSFPKPVSLIQFLIELVNSKEDNNLVLDFFAGSGTTGEAVMRLNAQDGGNRQFILVQVPADIDPSKQAQAHRFVTQTLQKPATIFEITAERLRRAGARIEAAQKQAENPTQAQLDGTQASHMFPVDTGFRVFDIVDDVDALVLKKPLSSTTQDDLAFFIGADDAPQQAATPANAAIPATVNVELAAKEHEQPPPAYAANSIQNIPVKVALVLHNLLLSENMPLSAQFITLKPSVLYRARDVLMVVNALDIVELANTLEALKAEGTPITRVTVYAPWVSSDSFMQGVRSLLESLGYSNDKLKLRS